MALQEWRAPRPRAGARIHYSPGGLREATSCILAVGSSTHLDPPWLRWPEAHGCVQAPYAHLPIAGGGLSVVMPPPTAPLRPGSERCASGAWVPRVFTVLPTPVGLGGSRYQR